jgi:hypothetical protein
MALHDDLLEQAFALAQLEPKKPRQASLRRAVGTAYYSLFHLLVDDAIRFLVGGSGPHRAALRHQLARSFEHRQMRTAAVAFSSATTRSAWVKPASGPISPTLRQVAMTFAELQADRHAADYDTALTLARPDVLATVAKVQQAFIDSRALRGKPERDAFMLALLLRSRE